MTNGWVPIGKYIQDQPWWHDPEAVKLYIYLHIKANHEEMQAMHNGKLIKLKKGQISTGRKRISADTGLSESKIERMLDLFTKCSEIEQRKTSTNRLITVLYKTVVHTSEQRMDSRWTADEQRMDTIIRSKESITKKEDVVYDDTVAVDKSYYDELFARLGKDYRAVELLMRNYRISKPQVKHLADQFFSSQEIVKKQWPSYTECLKHFKNWLTKQGDSVRAPIPEPLVDKTDIDDFYNSRMGPADRNPYQ